MKKAVLGALIGASIILCPILYFLVGPALNDTQWETMQILLIVCGISMAYCFIVGELTGNNSQMDKLWSILPAIYTWIIAVKGDMAPRLLVMAILATIWGARLTYNFARKGAYTWKFWTGEEDYRWKILREKEEFQPHWKWLLFNLFFISIYQNILVLATTLPALSAMNSDMRFGVVDYIATILVALCILYETIADEQQWQFQQNKWRMINEGQKLEDLPHPYNIGFNTTGLWGVSRHPNYFAEQSTWVCFYIFSIGAGVGIFNWSLIGALLLIVLFQGSANFGEEISASKYSEYVNYQKSVLMFFPFKSYRRSKGATTSDGGQATDEA